jgi:quercetin dioxygenase-like cupin family protein
MTTGHFLDVKEEPPHSPDMQATIRWLVAGKDGAPNFAMRVIEIKHAGEKIPLHRHDYEHEVFVFEGTGRALGRDGASPVGPGDFVFVPPGEEHGFENAGDGPFRFICVIPLPKQQ